MNLALEVFTGKHITRKKTYLYCNWNTDLLRGGLFLVLMESPKFAIALEKEEKHDYNW